MLKICLTFTDFSALISLAEQVDARNQSLPSRIEPHHATLHIVDLRLGAESGSISGLHLLDSGTVCRHLIETDVAENEPVGILELRLAE